MIELPLEFADIICGMQRKHKKMVYYARNAPPHRVFCMVFHIFPRRIIFYHHIYYTVIKKKVM